MEGFDQEYLESSCYGVSREFDKDFVGAFLKALLPGIEQKLDKALAESPNMDVARQDGTISAFKKKTPEAVGYQRVKTFIERYLDQAEVVPLPDVDPKQYEEVFGGEKLERLPKHKLWEASLAYMIMVLSNQIHTVHAAVCGNGHQPPIGDPWPREDQVAAVKKLKKMNDKISDITERISDHYFPFTCG